MVTPLWYLSRISPKGRLKIKVAAKSCRFVADCRRKLQ